MMSVERSEVDDDDEVFFDSSDALSVDEQAEFKAWSGELASVEERRARFLKRMGLLEEESVSLERINNDYSDEVSTSSGETELQCCIREDNYGSTNSMSDEELEEENVSERNSSPSRSFSKKKWFFNFNCFAGERVKDFAEASVISKVKVKSHKKSHVELSAAYKVQEIHGHKGKIWSLKFSPDGKYLATGGEDGVVKIWRITLSDSLFEPIRQQEETVLFPHMEETPFQELCGHTGDVLDLAWSDSNLLLSASKDKTVRLWRIGCDQCLHVFHHNNYVTCVEFNPVNKKSFISGCIDGKARVWSLSQERVIAWTDARDSITAISYQPSGNGFVVGCITGLCKFYQISGNDVLMEEQILIRGRNRITAVQFCPGSSDEVMVSSDDSKLRIIDKTQILHRFKASSKSGKQSSASFVSSSSGRHILSVRRGLGVYLWDNGCLSSKRSSRSFEYFQSLGVVAATAWSPPGSIGAGDDDQSQRAMRRVQSSGRLSRPSRVTATWPEEKLELSGNYDDFADAWRLVIVTASLDGVIRTFHNYGLPRRL